MTETASPVTSAKPSLSSVTSSADLNEDKPPLSTVGSKADLVAAEKPEVVTEPAVPEEPKVQ